MKVDSNKKTQAFSDQESPLDRAFRVFNRGRSKELSQNDYEALGFFRDPFEATIEPTDTRHDTTVPEIWEDGVLGSNLGTILAKGAGAVVIGPSGIGKTMIAKTIAAFHERGLIEEKALYVDIASLPTGETSEASADEEETSFPSKGDLDSAEILLIDNAADIWWQSPFLGGKQSNLVTIPKIVAFLSFFDYRRLSERAKKEGHNTFPFLGSTSYYKYYIPTLPPCSIRSILQTRIRNSLDSSSNPFTPDSLEEIAQYSIGLPVLALQIGRFVLDEFLHGRRSEDPIQLDFVREKIASTPYAISYGIIHSINMPKIIVNEKSDLEYRLPMGETRRQILETMALNSTFSGSGRFGALKVERKTLEHELGKPSSTISHHAAKLSEEGLVQTERQGTSVSYYLPPPIYNAIELTAYNRSA